MNHVKQWRNALGGFGHCRYGFFLPGLSLLCFLVGEPRRPYFIYLGKVLPFAIIALLIVYCLQKTTVLSYPYGLPEAIAVLAVVLVHLWKRNNLLSIAGGTVLYMVLVQCVFA